MAQYGYDPNNALGMRNEKKMNELDGYGNNSRGHDNDNDGYSYNPINAKEDILEEKMLELVRMKNRLMTQGSDVEMYMGPQHTASQQIMSNNLDFINSELISLRKQLDTVQKDKKQSRIQNQSGNNFQVNQGNRGNRGNRENCVGSKPHCSGGPPDCVGGVWECRSERAGVSGSQISSRSRNTIAIVDSKNWRANKNKVKNTPTKKGKSENTNANKIHIIEWDIDFIYSMIINYPGMFIQSELDKYKKLKNNYDENPDNFIKNKKLTDELLYLSVDKMVALVKIYIYDYDEKDKYKLNNEDLKKAEDLVEDYLRNRDGFIYDKAEFIDDKKAVFELAKLVTKIIQIQDEQDEQAKPKQATSKKTKQAKPKQATSKKAKPKQATSKKAILTLDEEIEGLKNNISNKINKINMLLPDEGNSKLITNAKNKMKEEIPKYSVEKETYKQKLTTEINKLQKKIDEINIEKLEDNLSKLQQKIKDGVYNKQTKLGVIKFIKATGKLIKQERVKDRSTKLVEALENSEELLNPSQNGGKILRKTPKRKSPVKKRATPKRASPKRTTAKRKSPTKKRASPKRAIPKRKSPTKKRASPKRTIPKRKSPVKKRASPKRVTKRR